MTTEEMLKVQGAHDELMAEIERLQWALREIVRIAPGAVSSKDGGAVLAMRMACIAGDALRADGQSVIEPEKSKGL